MACQKTFAYPRLPTYMKRLFFSAILFASFPLLAAEPQSSPPLELKPGDHIAIIGNTLADRFQHSGWLETFIYNRYPKNDLVFRNLAVAGDEVALRARPENFG